MTTRRDLTQTLEKMGMPLGDIQLWERYLDQVDIIKNKFSGSGVLNIKTINTEWLLSRNLHAGFRVSRTSNQAITATDNIEWDTEDRDTHGFVDLASDTENMTIPPGMGGYYIIGGQMTFAQRDPADTELISIIGDRSGTKYSACDIEPKSLNRVTISGLVRVTPGDTLYMQFTHDGSSGQIDATGNGTTVQTYMYAYLLIPDNILG